VSCFFIVYTLYVEKVVVMIREQET